MIHIDDAIATLLILGVSFVGIILLARGIAWLGDRASNWDGDLDR